MSNVDKLEVGKAYTYKELCSIIGEEEKTNRIAQHTRWDKFFTWEKRGRLYIILSIREVPLKDGRSNGNNGKYINFFKDIIMYYIAEETNMVYASLGLWLLKLNIVRSELYANYKELALKYDNLIGDLGSNIVKNRSQYYFKNCQIDISKFIDPKFYAAVDSLEKAGYITRRNTYEIVHEDDLTTLAEEDEVLEISETEQMVMHNLGYKSFLDAKYKDGLPKLYKEINEKMHEEFGYKKVYKVIGLKKTDISYQYKYITEDVEEAQENLSALIQKGLTQYFINKTENNAVKVEKQKDIYLENWYNDLDASDIKIPFEYENGYLENMLNIMDIFLSL